MSRALNVELNKSCEGGGGSVGRRRTFGAEGTAGAKDGG